MSLLTRVFGPWMRPRTKATLQSVDRRGGWWPLWTVREPYPGAWQQNVELRTEDVLAHAAVYACVTLIAGDISKMRMRLVKQNQYGIWEEFENTAHSPVLRKPNRFQNRIKFYEQWVTSKLVNGNTYVLKQRDARGVVSAEYVLDPTRVRPLVSEGGDVFYEVYRDLLAQAEDDKVAVPQSEIIHDVMVPLYHPLVGVSPIYACGVSAMLGNRITTNAASFFANGSNPGGVLTAPGHIPQEVADELKTRWEDGFTGENAGRVAVLGDGLSYTQLGVNAQDAQMIEQLKWTSENICTAFHVPPYMIGVGAPPTYNNIEALSIQYYSQCIQHLVECIELLQDEGLELPKVDGEQLGTEFDLDDLMRMDTPTKVKAAAESIKGAAMAPNEARYKYLDLGPLPGGDSIYLQQQNYSLEALAKRDAKEDPFGKSGPDGGGAPTPPPPPPDGGEEQVSEEAAAKLFGAVLTRAVGLS